MGEHQYHGVSTSATTPARYSRDSPQGTVAPVARPKIKIIHIIAPEIIKTDVANFRDLVQRLTGNQQPATGVSGAVDTPRCLVQRFHGVEEKETVKKRLPLTTERSDDSMAWHEPASKKMKVKCEVKVEDGGFGDYSSRLDRADLWMDLNPSGFLSFLEDDDVFQGLLAADHDCFQGPLGSSRLDFVGEMYAS